MSFQHRSNIGLLLFVAATICEACGSNARPAGTQLTGGTGVFPTAGFGAGTSSVVPTAGSSAGQPVTPNAGAGGFPSAGAGGTGAAGVGLAGAGAAGAGAADGGIAGTGSTQPVTPWTPMSNVDANGNLIVPATGEGYQLQTTTFDLQPNQEVFACYHVQVPNDATFAVGEWDGQMSAGSHHFILYRDDADTTPSGTLVKAGCTMGFGGSTWLYTQGTPRSHLAFPEGVAMELTPHEHIVFDMHYINTTESVLHASVTLNINKVRTEPYVKAGSQVSFNIGIRVPAHGTQTVGGDCQPVPGANYFVMQTHTHKHATLAVVNRSTGGVLGEELVRTTNWDSPQAHVWDASPFLTFAAGETFHYSCSYQNDSNVPVTVGTSAATNEMCMAEAYYFPLAANPGACN